MPKISSLLSEMHWINSHTRALDAESTKYLLSFTLALMIITLVIWKWHDNENHNESRLPPGPKALPLIGCIHKIAMNKPAFRWIHKMMEEMNTEIACFRLGSTHVIAVTSPELACEFLKRQDAAFSSRPRYMSTEVLADGYLSAALTPFSDQWKKMRKVIASEVVSPARLRWLQHKRVEDANHLSLHVYNLCQNTSAGGLVNLRNVTRHYCANVTRNMIFGKRFFGVGMKDGGPGPEEEEHVTAMFTILSYMNAFGISDYLPLLRVFDLEGHKKILKEAVKCMRKYHDPIVDERIRAWRKGLKVDQEDILDALINLRDSDGDSILTPAEIKAQIIETFVAAVDNPSNAAEWALVEMINQPKILQKAMEELDRVVGRNRLVQESDLPMLAYIRACTREAYRLHPVSPFGIPHESTINVNVGGYFIPKGSHIIISRLALGRNHRFWDEPSMFKPKRHLKGDGSKVVLTDSELRLFTFGTGNRGCPGVELGSTMSFMLLARLVQGFAWSIPTNMLSLDLTEFKKDLSLAKPLVLVAKPRLSLEILLQIK